MTATDEPLVLEAVIADGCAEEAMRSMRAHATGRQLLVPFLVKAAFVGVVVALTRQPAWLLLLPVWMLVVHLLGPRVGLGAGRMRSIALRPGSLISVEWREHEVAVRRPAGTVHFAYAGMEVADRTAHLVALWVQDVVGDRNRKLLFLPSELVPPEVVALFQPDAAAGLDPFGAARMERVLEIPLGWPRADYQLSTARKAAIAVLVSFEVLVLGLLALSGEWAWALAGTAAIVALGTFARTAPFRQARRRLPPGALVGVSFADGRVAIVLPDQRVDLPESRLRNVIPAGIDLVLFQFKDTNLALLPLPRQLVSDQEIDRLRVAAGRRPMRPSQRLN